jgi:hypothetical protein
VQNHWNENTEKDRNCNDGQSKRRDKIMEGSQSQNEQEAVRGGRNGSKSLGFLTAVALICLPATTIWAQRVQLAWTPSPSPNIVEYGIYRSNHPDSSFTLLEILQHPDTTYEDRNVQWNRHYFYAATAMDRFGNESGFSNVVDTVVSLSTSVENTTTPPEEFYLYQNHPNPFKLRMPATTISYTLPQNGHVKLTIFDMTGREVYRLVEGFQKAGHYSIHWEGKDFRGKSVASGVYYYKLEALNGAKFRKMIVLR